MDIRKTIALFALSVIVLSAGKLASADPRPDPFAPFSTSGYHPFTIELAPKLRPKIYKTYRITPDATRIGPLPKPAPTAMPAPQVSQAAPATVPLTKSWNVIGLIQGDTVPQAILTAGQESYVVAIGDDLPDGSAKLVSIDNVSVTLRSRVGKSDIRIDVGATGLVPVTSASQFVRL